MLHPQLVNRPKHILFKKKKAQKKAEEIREAHYLFVPHVVNLRPDGSKLNSLCRGRCVRCDESDFFSALTFKLRRRL